MYPNIMKLLILTQKVDKNDPILGFFHGWLVEFSRHFETITVICLEKGDVDLPHNIITLSLGKEHGKSRVKYLWNFYRSIWRERNNYDTVFVHMNQEYILLGAPVWKILEKKTILWYNHTNGNILTRVAMLLADTVCHTSPFAFTANAKKSLRMPAGINTYLFKPLKHAEHKHKSIMYIGRIAPLKKVEVLIEAAKKLDKEGVDFVLDIYGPVAEKDRRYFEYLRKLSATLQKKVFFRGAVSNEQTPVIFNDHSVSVNLTPKGNYDKTVLEASACGTVSLVSSEAFSRIVKPEQTFREGEVDDLCRKLLDYFSLSVTERQRVVDQQAKAVSAEESLEFLAEKLTRISSRFLTKEE